MAWAGGFFGAIGDAALQKAKEHRDNDQKLKDGQAQVYWDAIKSGNLSPEQTEYAQSQLQKLYGGSKPIKELFNKFGQITKAAHGHLAGQQGDAGGGQPPPPPTDAPAAAGTPPPPAQMTPPPGATPKTAAGAANVAQGAGATASPQSQQQPPAKLTAPPSFASVASAAYPSPESVNERKTQMSIAAERTEIAERKRLAKEIGNLPEGSAEWREYVYGVKPAAAGSRDKYSIQPDKDGNLVAVDTEDPTKVVRVTDATGQPVTRQTKAGAAPKVISVDGVPIGVMRDGKTMTPDSPDWTAPDATLFAAAQTAYKTGEGAKTARQERAMQSYARMRGLVQEYSVIDKTTGEPTEANANTINANPGRYSAAPLYQQLKNRDGVFKEISYTTGQARDAIKALPDDGFNAETRAQLALVLKNPDPESALSTFMSSNYASTLTPEQIDYVTALVSLQESAMSLRTVAGMGQGSDTLRAAISKMLPGPGTPSREYANRQMDLFEGEVKQLRSSLPPSLKDAGSANAPSRPSNVPADYIFMENGPKGRGWYKPKATGRMTPPPAAVASPQAH